jgi:hypothetical protein
MGEPNPATTFLGEDVKIVWVRKSTGEVSGSIIPDVTHAFCRQSCPMKLND